MDRAQLEQLLAVLREREMEAMLALAHIRGRIATATEILAQEDKDDNSGAAAGVPTSDNG